MPLVICDRAELCASDLCSFRKPTHDVELGIVHCKHHHGKVRIMTLVASYKQSMKDIKNPNWAFVRKKHGL